MIKRHTRTRTPVGLSGLVVLLSIVALLGAACTRASIAPTVSPTPSPAPAVTGAVTEIPKAAMPTLSAVPDTPAVQPPPTDLCREHLRLSARSGERKKEAVATSYQCRNAHIDSTGQSDASADWSVLLGASIDFQFDVEQGPTEVEARLYPGVGVSASFMRWPEELPTNVEAVDVWRFEPGAPVEILPQAPAGPYSLVVRAAWGEDVEVYYALSLTLEEAAAPTPTPPRSAAPALPSIGFSPEQATGEVRPEVMNQIGGHSLAVAVERGRVYLGTGPRLVLLDRSPSLEEFSILRQSEALPGPAYRVALYSRFPYRLRICWA